ncbi:MAG: hypothetical protein R3C56_20590 [Pirellulaceae bacterium]
MAASVAAGLELFTRLSRHRLRNLQPIAYSLLYGNQFSMLSRHCPRSGYRSTPTAVYDQPWGSSVFYAAA